MSSVLITDQLHDRASVPEAPLGTLDGAAVSGRSAPTVITGTGSTAQAGQGDAPELVRAASVRAQGSQSTQAAGRVIHRAAGSTQQASQSTQAAGRIVNHSNGGSAQASQSTDAAGRVEYHATGGSNE
jgi:hypothetical protein